MIKENVIKETFNAKETFEIGYQLGQLAKKGTIGDGNIKKDN